MTTRPDHADALDELTAQQRAAQDLTAAAREQRATVRHDIADQLAVDAAVTDEQLDRLAATQEVLELAELRELGLARARRRLVEQQLGTGEAAPLTDDPRGVVRIRVAGRPGRHACNQPSTGRALEGGQELDVTPDDAIDLATAGYVELVGEAPAWWPRTIPAHGQQLAGTVAVG